MDIKDYKIIDCGGGIVLNDKNQIAIIYMSDMGTWDFPKGGVENNESFYETAIREIYEEAGIKNLVFVKKLPIYKRPASNGKPLIMNTYMYLFKTNQKTIQPSTKDDVSEAKWVNKDNVINCLSLEDGKKYFKSIENEI